MNSKDWFDLALIFTPFLALIYWLMISMWRDNRAETRRHAAVLKQNAVNFSNQDTKRSKRNE